MTRADGLALAALKWLLLAAAPGLAVAAVILTLTDQPFRESVFGPDYYTRSTPAYHGQSPWWRAWR